MPDETEQRLAVYFFHGKILPERANFNLRLLDRGVTLQDRKIKFSIFAFASEFNGWLETSPSFDNMSNLSETIGLIIRNILDRYSFTNICGYGFDLIGTIGPEAGAQ